MIENTRLYSYSGDGDSWSWTQIGTLAPTITSTSAAWTVARSLLGETAFPNGARVCFETEDTADVRDTSPAYAHVYSNEAIAVHAQVAYNDGSDIFYQATFDQSFSHKHVFIDTDKNASTGFEVQGAGLVSGANYMIENNSVYRYTGTGEDWSWTNIGPSNMAPSTQGATGITTWTIPRSLILETGDPESAHLVFHGDPASGSSIYTVIYDHVYSGGAGSPPPPPPGGTVDTGYVLDTNEKLRNPERGIYYSFIPDPANTDHYHTIVAAWLRLAPYCDRNLVWLGKDHPDTSSVLRSYANLLEDLRDAGVKVLFRAKYSHSDSSQNLDNVPAPNCGTFHAETLELQKQHITEVAKMLGAYKDVVGFIHMGYLGRWGEWNTDGYDKLTTAPLMYNKDTRREIVDHVLSEYALRGLTQDVEMRRPVLAKEVLLRNANANVGFHNDCFMSTYDDYGTHQNFDSSNTANFANNPDDSIAWGKTFTQTASFGGETCGSASISRWDSCTNMIGSSSEPAAFHMNYLNAEWATGAKDYWTTNGCYNEIRRKLGYRFEVTRVVYPQTVAAGQPFTIQIDIRNSGWARLHKHRTAYLRLRNGGSMQQYTPQNSATEEWDPGETVTLTATGNAPSSPGPYQVRLAIPDPFATASIPYAVKLASKRNGVNVFDNTYGENNLGVTVTVQ